MAPLQGDKKRRRIIRNDAPAAPNARKLTFSFEVDERPAYAPNSGPPLLPISLAPPDDAEWIVNDQVVYPTVGDGLPRLIVAHKTAPAIHVVVDPRNILDYVSQRNLENFSWQAYKSDAEEAERLRFEEVLSRDAQPDDANREQSAHLKASKKRQGRPDKAPQIPYIRLRTGSLSNTSPQKGRGMLDILDSITDSEIEEDDDFDELALDRQPSGRPLLHLSPQNGRTSGLSAGPAQTNGVSSTRKPDSRGNARKSSFQPKSSSLLSQKKNIFSSARPPRAPLITDSNEEDEKDDDIDILDARALSGELGEPVDVMDEQDFIINAILGEEIRVINGRKTLYYLIDWEGDWDHTWEPANNVSAPAKAEWEQLKRSKAAKKQAQKNAQLSIRGFLTQNGGGSSKERKKKDQGRIQKGSSLLALSGRGSQEHPESDPESDPESLFVSERPAHPKSSVAIVQRILQTGQAPTNSHVYGGDARDKQEHEPAIYSAISRNDKETSRQLSHDPVFEDNSDEDEPAQEIGFEEELD